MAEIIGRTQNGHILTVRNEDGDGRLVYYLDNIEIGGYSPKVTSEKIIFRMEFFKKQEIWMSTIKNFCQKKSKLK